MENAGTAPPDGSEIERLQVEVQRLQQDRDRALDLLTRLRHLAQQALFWDGTPETLSELAMQIRQAFGYQAVSFLFWEGGELCCRAADPPVAAAELYLNELDSSAVAAGSPWIASGCDRLLIVPLVIERRPLGLIEILLQESPTPELADLWQALGPQVAAIINGGRLLNQAREARRRQQLLYNVTRRLAPSMDLGEMLSTLLALVIPCVNAEDGAIVLLDEQGQISRYVLAEQPFSEEQREQFAHTLMEGTWTAQVMERQRSANAGDDLADDRCVVVEGGTERIRSVLLVPIQHGERVLGLFSLAHHTAHYFVEDHLSFLSSVADQAAITIENAHLLKERQRQVDELALLNEIGRAVSSLHLNDVLRIATQRIVQALPVRRCAVFLLDSTGTRLVLRAAHNPNLVSDRLNLEVSLLDRPHIQQAIKTRRPAVIRDVFAEQRLCSFWDKARELDIFAQLAVPLISRGRVIGAIEVARGRAAPLFKDGEINLCQTIAHQAANAIENARLYEEAQQRAERLALVNTVSHDVGAILEVDLLLWEVVRLIRETLDCYHVAVALIEGNELVFQTGVNYLYESMSRMRLFVQEGEGIAAWVAQNGRPLWVPDVSQDSRYKPFAQCPETRSELAVPLKVPEWTQVGSQGASRIIGVLDVHSTEVGAFSAEDQALLEALAAQIAVAIESARLFGRVREEQATLEAILDGTGDAIIVTDLAGCILFFNPAAQSIFLGNKPLEPDSFISQVVRNPVLLDLWGQVWPEGTRTEEVPLPDGRTLYASMTLVAGVGKIAVMQDVTHFKEVDRVKSEFVSTVSHDLRSPLQAIQTSAEILPRLGELSAEQHKEVDHILAVVRRMFELVQNLLDIARIEAGIGMEIEACAIDEIVASAAGSCRHLAQKKGLKLAIDLPKTLPLVKGNRLRLDQVVSNLVTNAIKFTSEGSVVVKAQTKNGEVVIEVADTGIGIPPDAQEQLFQKFYRVKSPETRGIPGTGLGLAIAKSIVESYGGRIEIESFPRLGSTFRVSLPVYGDEQRESGGQERLSYPIL